MPAFFKNPDGQFGYSSGAVPPGAEEITPIAYGALVTEAEAATAAATSTARGLAALARAADAATVYAGVDGTPEAKLILARLIYPGFNPPTED